MKHQARKRFGQNFLIDRDIIRRIIASISPQAGETIIEIGPGQEALTEPLANAGVDLKLVEIDRDLGALLAKRYPAESITIADALQVDFTAIAGPVPYRLVGNLPYNISTPLMFHVLAQDPLPVDMHFMLQKEVVDRMVAGPGSGDFGRLSLMCQNLAQITPLLPVGPECFAPRPRVDSSFVRLVPRAQPQVPLELTTAFSEVVKQAFSMRRKTLRNSLKPLMDEAAIQAAGIDPKQRPEQLGLAEFMRLTEVWQEKT